MTEVTKQRVDQVREEGKAAVFGAFVQELKDIRKGGWGNVWGYFFIAPAVIMYLVFQAWPIVRGLFMAFSDYRWLIPETQGLSGFNGLDNWVELISDKDWWRSVTVAVKFSAMVLPATLALSLFVAVMISRVKNGLAAGVYRVISYMPVILPISVAMLVWGKLFDVKFGYLNVTLGKLGVANPPNWLGSPDVALYSMSIATVWRQFGHWTLLFLIGIYNINREIYEAALVDGTNGWQQFWYITLPLLKPVFTLVLVLGSGIISATVEVMALFGVGTSWGSLAGGGPGESCLTAGFFLYRTAFSIGDMRMGYAASMSLFLGVVNMLITAFVFKTLRSERH
jgi:multiple sugar transport system permease protein